MNDVLQLSAQNKELSPDQIHPRVLKPFADTLSSVLVGLFNFTLEVYCSF